jgi:aspartyl-tRNA(Asn)/glutamyl-tRNA(Gln) amidotransferase subunit A
LNDRDLMFLPARTQRQMIIRGEVSSVELTEASLRRIKKLEPKLNAFITVDEEGALKAAKAADRAQAKGGDLGPYHGVPISVKDLETTKGLRTTLGCAVYKEWVPDFDSVVAERVKRMGAIILGKTNTPEFGNREETYTKFHPAANNPWDVKRHPGGSSGGAAASVASGMCAIATGTDGGGSVRLPASFCGIFGLKPTQGRWPRYGGVAKMALNPTSTSGPMTNDVTDAAILCQAVSGHDPRDSGSLRAPVPDYVSELNNGVKSWRVGVSMDMGFAQVNDDVAKCVDDAANAFSELGAKVSAAPLKFDPPPREYWWTVWCGNQAAMYGQLAEERPQDLMDYTLEMVKHGRTLTAADFTRALRQAEVHRLMLTRLFEEYDVIITPGHSAVAWPHRTPPKQVGSRKPEGKLAGISYGAIPFTMAFNISWNPAASVPCGYGEGGMPVGLQVVGAHDRDDMVLRACRSFEQARPWTGRRPAVS